MPQRRQLLITGAAGLLGAAASGALQLAHAQTSLPTEVAQVLPGAQRAGSARLRVFGFNIYDATLWVGAGFSAATFERHPLVLELAYLRGLRGPAIAQRSLQEMARIGSFSPVQSQGWLAAMQASFPDVQSGDRLTGRHRPDSGADFWLNGQARPGIADPAFSRLFFGIWLSPATSEPELRRALLAPLTP